LDESWGMTILGSKAVILKAVLQQRHCHLAPPRSVMSSRRLMLNMDFPSGARPKDNTIAARQVDCCTAAFGSPRPPRFGPHQVINRSPGTEHSLSASSGSGLPHVHADGCPGARQRQAANLPLRLLSRVPRPIATGLGTPARGAEKTPIISQADHPTGTGKFPAPARIERSRLLAKALRWRYGAFSEPGHRTSEPARNPPSNRPRLLVSRCSQDRPKHRFSLKTTTPGNLGVNTRGRRGARVVEEAEGGCTMKLSAKNQLRGKIAFRSADARSRRRAVPSVCQPLRNAARPFCATVRADSITKS
jgi:hypothetical protein